MIYVESSSLGLTVTLRHQLREALVISQDNVDRMIIRENYFSFGNVDSDDPEKYLLSVVDLLNMTLLP